MDQNTPRCSEEIKNRLLKIPTLHLPDNIGRIQLFSYTKKSAAGSALYQFQKWYHPNLKDIKVRLPPTEVSYSITELLDLFVNSSPFKHLLAKVDFDCTVNHLALAYIMKVKLNQPVQELKDYEKFLVLIHLTCII